jgi:hypothetical protein
MLMSTSVLVCAGTSDLEFAVGDGAIWGHVGSLREILATPMN